MSRLTSHRSGVTYVLDSDTRASDITVDAGGFVIVGTDLDVRRDEVAATWTSPDGITWREHLTSLGDQPGFSLAEVAAGGGVLVAVGPDGIWRSTDAQTWEQVGESTMLGPYVTDVTWGPHGFAAIGHDVAGTALVWGSMDGRSWEQASTSTALAAFCPLKIAGGPKGYVAVGNVAVGGDCSGSSVPVIAVSLDGRSWVRAPQQPSLAGEGAARGIVAGGPGWIAFGTYYSAGVASWGNAVWISSDGLSWRRTAFLRPVPPFVPDCGTPGLPASMTDIAAFGPGYVAVGVSWCGNDQWGAAWASPDGTTWQSVGLNPSSDPRFWLLRAVAVKDGRLVAAAAWPWVDYLPAAVSAVLAP